MQTFLTFLGNSLRCSLQQCKCHPALTLRGRAAELTPDGLFIIARDFNHSNLKSLLLKLHQHVDFAVRGKNGLDLVYTNISACREQSLAPTSDTQTTCHAISSMQTARQTLETSSEQMKLGLQELSLLFRTVLSTVTGTCSGKLYEMATAPT